VPDTDSPARGGVLSPQLTFPLPDRVTRDVKVHVKVQLPAREERLATQLTAVFRLNELSTITIPVGKIETLYEYMLEAAVALMHSQYASLQLLEADGDKGDVLRLLAHRGFHPRSALHWQRVYVEATTTCGVALRTRKRFTIPDIEQWEGIKGSLDEEAYRGSGIRSVQSTPLFPVPARCWE
jgi:hypothetical protein